MVEKMAELKVAPAQVIIDEPTVDENTIMRAYEALMAEDPRWGQDVGPFVKARSEGWASYSMAASLRTGES